MMSVELSMDVGAISERDSLNRNWVVWLGEADYSPNFRPASDFREKQIVVRKPDQRALRLFFRSDSLPPEAATNGFCTAIFDGQIDNLIELCSYGKEFRSSNSEIVLQAYLKFGDQFLNRIRGIYSLIIWDSSKDLFLAARDRLGIRSLFYAQQKNGTLFSPSIDLLLEDRNVSSKINRILIAERLCNIWNSHEETYYETIKRVPSGHAIEIKGANREIYRYWHPPASDSDVEWVGEDELECFDKKLEQTLTLCLEHGKSGIFLSGGLDSVSIAAVATDVARRNGLPLPLALSLFLPHPDCNEKSVQKGVAEKLGLNHIAVAFDGTLNERDWFESALDLSRNLPSPLMNFWLPAYINLAEIAKEKGCRTILTGGGGDEWLTVSPYFAADLMRKFDFKGLYYFWKNQKSSYNIPSHLLLRNVFWRFSLRLLLGSVARRLLLAGLPSLLYRVRGNRMLKSLPVWALPDADLKKDLMVRMEQKREEAEVESYYLREMLLALDHPLVALEMEENHQIERKLGMRIHQSYWNAEIVELLYRIPPRILNRGDRSKGLVREMVNRRFPNLGFDNQKKINATGFFDSLVKEQARLSLQRLGRLQKLVELGIVDEKRLDLSNSSFSGNRISPTFLTWELTNMEAWLRARA